MTKPIQIVELNQTEVNRLLADTVYNRFIPVKCNDCGTTSGFDRRIFHIMGVQKDKYSDDTTQNILRHHFFHQSKIECIFFRTNAKKFYVDSASCQTCKSMSIVFDLNLEDRAVTEYMEAIASGMESSL